MRIHEILTEEQLNEIDRRGFLKGLGVASLLGKSGISSANDSNSWPPEFRNQVIKNIMSDVMKSDKMVIGYQVKGDTLIIKINNNRPITDIKSYGFDNGYKDSIKFKTGIKNVEFATTVDSECRPVWTQVKQYQKDLPKNFDQYHSCLSPNNSRKNISNNSNHARIEIKSTPMKWNENK